MRGIKKCVNWMIDNPMKSIKRGNIEFRFDIKNDSFQVLDCNEWHKTSCFKKLIFDGWEPVKEPVDFMTAINSGKKMYPVEYFGKRTKEELTTCYFKGSEEGVSSDIDGLWIWFRRDVETEDQVKYINGMWYLED